MGTMVGGHYVAYTLVDPERMFEDGEKVVQAVKEMSLDGERVQEAGTGVDGSGETVPVAMPSSEAQGGRKRVWCYCSE